MNFRSARAIIQTVVMTIMLIGLCLAQTAYQPKFKGDPARSDSEANALGYMRTVIRAEKQYDKKNNKYASSLTQLIHTGSFTRRMSELQQGDYRVEFRSHKDGYDLLMTPQQEDAQHRSFFANEDGTIHADEQGTATADSPKI